MQTAQKIPFMQVASDKGYSMNQLTEVLSSLGINPFSAEAEGLSQEEVDLIPEFKTAAPKAIAAEVEVVEESFYQDDEVTGESFHQDRETLDRGELMECYELDGDEVEEVLSIAQVEGSQFDSEDLQQIESALAIWRAQQTISDGTQLVSGIQETLRDREIELAQLRGVTDAAVEVAAYVDTKSQAAASLLGDLIAGVQSTRPGIAPKNKQTKQELGKWGKQSVKADSRKQSRRSFIKSATKPKSR